MVIGAIVEIGVEGVLEKAKRREAVIKALRKVGLDPATPPADFDGVYAYTLVEYGVGKPKPILDFFRQEFVREAFHQAFERRDPTILREEAKNLIEWHEVGEEFQRMDIDPRREFARFTAVFNQIVDRTRTPAEVRREHKLDDIHEQVAKLDKLETLDEIRSAVSRLARQSRLTIQEPHRSPDRMAARLEAWLESLGYRFEDHRLRTDDYFERIVNISEHNHRERVLVRGVRGEAGVLHVRSLGQAVGGYGADTGWLVAPRRVSQAARNEAGGQDHLRVCTFDELVDHQADFSRYLEWLETEVCNRGIARMYVPLACTKKELDPVTGKQIELSRYGEDDGWVDGYVDRWLVDPAKEHLSVLGEFGTGKTWFALHYAWKKKLEYEEAKQRGVERPRLPVYVPLRDYAKVSDVERLLSQFLLQEHQVPLPGYEALEQLNEMGRLLLIFDGFDEMAARVSRQKMVQNFWELTRVVVPGAKVILTCRTEHFPTEAQGRRLLGARVYAPNARVTGEPPQFEILKLAKFDEDQIELALSSRSTSPAVRQKILNSDQLLDLARRPLMVEYILDALPDIEAGKPADLAHVLLYATTRKMNRDIRSERTFTSLADKLYFMSELSWEMVTNDQMRIHYSDFPDRIRTFFGPAVQKQKELDHWKHDMMGQTMLVRDDVGNYEPAHRPIAEFFTAYKVAGEMGALEPEFEEVATQQGPAHSDQRSRTYSWTDYFHGMHRDDGDSCPRPFLQSFASEPLSRLSQTGGKYRFGRALLEMLAGMAKEKALWDVIDRTRGHDFQDTGYLGGNALGALKVSDADLTNKDFSETVLAGADLSEANLRAADLTKTDLREADLRNTILENAVLVETNLSRAEIEEWGAVSSIAAHPEADQIATAIFDATVKFWETGNWNQIGAIRNLPNAAMTIDYSHDGSLLACGHWDGSLIVWEQDGSTWRQLRQVSVGFPLYGVAFSLNNRFLASADLDGYVRVWEIDDWKQVASSRQHSGAAYCVRFDPESKVLASCGADGDIKLQRTEDWELIGSLHLDSGYARGLAWSPEGTRLVVGSEAGDLTLWDIQEREKLRTVESGSAGVIDLDWSSDGELIASGGMDKSVVLWKPASHQDPRRLIEYADTVFAVRFTPEGRHLVTGSDEWLIKIWNRDADTVHSLVQSNWKGAELKDLIGVEESKMNWLQTRTGRPWEGQSQETVDPTQLVSRRSEEFSTEDDAVPVSSEDLPPEALRAPGELLDISEKQLFSILRHPSLAVLAEFSTSWCGPSRRMEAVLRDLAARYGALAYIVRVDIDKNRRAFSQYHIKGIPTLIIFKNGRPVDRFEGWAPKNILKSRLDAVLECDATEE